MKWLTARDLANEVGGVVSVAFWSDESIYPERITFVLSNGSRVVIAAREDGCLDVVLEEA